PCETLLQLNSPTLIKSSAYRMGDTPCRGEKDEGGNTIVQKIESKNNKIAGANALPADLFKYSDAVLVY
ncbi:unnamed protein product, partial [Ceratitis capitata]